MRELLSLLPKPSRYVGIEEGSVHKNREKISLRVALAFPDMYEVGMSYLGQKILYSIINEHPDWLAERVFTPCREAGALLQQRKVSLATLEHDTPLGETDVIGFSVTHELCYTNILYMLDLAHIPLRTEQRKTPQANGRPWPLLVAGGGCTLAAEPLAPFMDIMVLGEGEEVLPELLACIETMRKNQQDRYSLLLAASRIPGIYVPEFFEEKPSTSPPFYQLRPLQAHHTHVSRRVIPNMDTALYPHQQPIPFGAVHNRLALEIGRGCTRGCRFCQAGSIYRPARERSTQELQKLLDKCLSGTGFDDISLLSLSTGDFSALQELFTNAVTRCTADQVSMSLPSLRVGSIDDSIMERMSHIRRTGATLAPEAGSQRLRDVINKGITEDEVILHIQKLFEHGWQQVKLYFMIGLPTETDEDLHAIIELCRKARDAAGPGIKRLQITAAVSPFVPKPHTPFQWEEQISLEEIRRRVGVLLDAVRKEKRIKLRWHEPEMSTLEGVFSRGDRRLANVVEKAYRKGAIFTSWMEGFSLDPWRESLAEEGLTIADYTRARTHDEPLPWDHLHSGLSREFLLRESRHALQEKTTSDCRYTHCHQCGVCDTKAGPSLLDPLPDAAPTALYIPHGHGPLYANRLNKPQRDQKAHTVTLDQYQRVVVRHTDSPESEKKYDASHNAKAAPPELAPHLIKKAAQFRIWYARQGAAAFLSQLELQSIFERTLRRAAIPLAFSQGFHPLPLISFGRALPVGVYSKCEWFSVYLREDFPLEATALNIGLPKDMHVTHVEALPLLKKSADALHEGYTLEAMVPEKEYPEFSTAWENIAAAKTLPWLRETKKGMRSLDARAYITSIDCTKTGLCTLEFSWEAGYISPLALCLAALEAVDYSTDLTRIRLTKVRQTE